MRLVLAQYLLYGAAAECQPCPSGLISETGMAFCYPEPNASMLWLGVLLGVFGVLIVVSICLNTINYYKRSERVYAAD